MANVVNVDLKSSQLSGLVDAGQTNQPWVCLLSQKQVANSGENQPNKLFLTKAQLTTFNNNKAKGKGVKLRFSKLTVHKMIKSGGFFGAIIPALAAMAPGLIGSAPQILNGIKSGFETFGRLLGIKKGKGEETLDNVLDQVLEERGSSLMNFGSSVNQGDSLRNFGPIAMTAHSSGRASTTAARVRKAPKVAKNE